MLNLATVFKHKNEPAKKFKTGKSTVNVVRSLYSTIGFIKKIINKDKGEKP